MSMVRAMISEDLPGVLSVTNAAFGALHAPGAHAEPARHAIPALLFAVRFTADPGGCFVAVREQDPGQVSGALFSVARGTLARIGPLAVHPDAQRSGAGGKLITACLGQLPAAQHPPDGAGDLPGQPVPRALLPENGLPVLMHRNRVPHPAGQDEHAGGRPHRRPAARPRLLVPGPRCVRRSHGHGAVRRRLRAHHRRRHRHRAPGTHYPTPRGRMVSFLAAPGTPSKGS